MTRGRMLGRALLVAAGLGLLAAPAAAQETAPARRPLLGVETPPFPAGGSVELGGTYHVLNEGQSDWAGVYARAFLNSDPDNTWRGEVSHDKRFGEQGTFVGLGLTHAFDPDWYAEVSAGTSAGGFFLPDFRADAFLNRKWLDKRQLITTLGAGYYDAKDVHRDASLFVGLAYYFDVPLVAQAGVRANLSDPGSVWSVSGFVALTYGREKEYYVIGRVGFGREAYQAIGPAEAIVDFPSQVVTLTWKQWVRRDWGFRWLGEYYHNPQYERVGFELGLFVDF